MRKLSKVVVATRNPAKKDRYCSLLLGIADTVLSLEDLGINDKPNEFGSTAEENAEIKAKFYFKKTGLAVFSEDEALYVDFLPRERQPGVHVRRVEGKEEADDDKLLAYWEEMVSKAPKGKRTGKWRIAYCLTVPGNKTKTIALDHPILFFSPSSSIKKPGWPMSSLEGPAVFGKPESELTEEERRMHEAASDKQLAEKLKELL